MAKRWEFVTNPEQFELQKEYGHRINNGIKEYFRDNTNEPRIYVKLYINVSF